MPNNSSNRKMPVFAANSHITARVNGGRLSVISRLLTTSGSDRWFRDPWFRDRWFRNPWVAATTLSSFGLGHHRQAAVPLVIERPHCEDQRVLRYCQTGRG